MKKIRVYFGYALYHSFAKYLPVSSASKKLCIGKSLRRICAKMMLEKCGKNVTIQRKASFSTKIEIGDNSGIGINATITGKTIIGNNVMMGPDCVIYTRNHRFDDCTKNMIEQGYFTEEPVVIGDDVWIGGRVTILPGVHIGNHCIIGASSVVTKDVPDWAVACGNPARVKKFRKD